ncbi:helix-turn-helix domain-containing protein [Fulvivirga maritima]|uniref:helix-turn-helix domain-containing protein n=1 Tax=Fulvivirga maritima TaxID=2904247 RepID=UPI001F1FB2F6|nr:helix-turn-helix transcriptional regulator [Fulvivirga maritima]UII27655.1 helix-turn-helix domain-containing protein [Fulvivirga maritima]
MGQIRNDKLLKEIAIQVKRIRESKGLTQEEVYNDTGIHVGRIETAKSNVTVSTLHALCDYFGMKLSKLLKLVEG